MSLDLQKVRQQDWQPRQREIKADALEKGATWTVRAPTANELAKANEAQAQRQRLDGVVTAMERGRKSDVVTAVRDAFALGDDIRPDIARRVELLTQCSVAPECSDEDAVWLGEKHPTLFYALTNAILELAGEGAEVKKPQSASTAKAG